MSSSKWGVVSLLVLSVALSAALIRPGLAEDPEDTILGLIDKGRAAYTAGETQAAIDHLQKAVALLQKSASEGLAKFLPAPPEGWKADDPDISSGSFGSGSDVFQWSSAERQYTRPSDEVEVTVVITTSPQIVEPQRAMLKVYENPQYRQMLAQNAEMKIEVVDQDGWKGISIVKEGEDASIVAFNGRMMVNIAVGNGSGEILRKFWGSMKLAGLAGPSEDEDDEGE